MTTRGAFDEAVKGKRRLFPYIETLITRPLGVHAIHQIASLMESTL